MIVLPDEMILESDFCDMDLIFRPRKSLNLDLNLRCFELRPNSKSEIRFKSDLNLKYYELLCMNIDIYPKNLTDHIWIFIFQTRTRIRTKPKYNGLGLTFKKPYPIQLVVIPIQKIEVILVIQKYKVCNYQFRLYNYHHPYNTIYH